MSSLKNYSFGGGCTWSRSLKETVEKCLRGVHNLKSKENKVKCLVDSLEPCVRLKATAHWVWLIICIIHVHWTQISFSKQHDRPWGNRKQYSVSKETPFSKVLWVCYQIRFTLNSNNVDMNSAESLMIHLLFIAADPLTYLQILLY